MGKEVEGGEEDMKVLGNNGIFVPAVYWHPLKTINNPAPVLLLLCCERKNHTCVEARVLKEKSGIG